MPVLVLAARLCPEGMEATLFATLMSISNGGSVLGGLIGAGLTQVFGVTKDRFDNLAFLIILCNITSLLPLPLLGLLPDDDPDSESEESADIEMKSNWVMSVVFPYKKIECLILLRIALLWPEHYYCSFQSKRERKPCKYYKVRQNKSHLFLLFIVFSLVSLVKCRQFFHLVANQWHLK